MANNRLQYSVCQNEYITNWLTSKVQETPFEAKMVPMVFENYHPGASVKRADGKERTSPAKDEFLEKGFFQRSAYPERVQMDDLYWPFDTTRVDFTGFWHFPCDITFYAKAFVSCEVACEQPVELYTCGAVRVWVNGLENGSFYPYESNLETGKEMVLSLQTGVNEIVVGCNNYGERNIVFEFGMKNLGSDMQVFLPVSADLDRMHSINSSLEDMYLDKLSYTRGEIVLCTDTGFACDCTLQVKAAGVCRELTVRQGQREAVFGNAEDVPIGYHEFVVFCNVDGVILLKTLWAEVYPESLETASPKSLEERKQLVCEFIIQHTRPGFEQYIAHLSRGENRFEEYREIIETIVTHVRRRGDCSDFRAAKILWVLNKFGSLLTKEQTAYLEETLLQFRYWFDEKGNDAMWFFSENHALCFHTCQMLAGELFPDRVFTNSGLTGREQSEKAKVLIVEWFGKLLEYGYNEWNSAAYIPVDMLSYISLLELCRDSEIRLLAKEALDYTYELFAKNSFKGLMGTSNGRTYPRDLLANKNLGTNPLLWLAWGEGCLNAHVDPLLFLALSKYQPPGHLEELAKWEKKEKLECLDVQGTNRVPTVLCKTGDYILGTCVSPRTGGPGSQEHLLNIFIKDYRSRIWINHPGEGKVFGEKRPGYFSGNGLTPLVSQRGNVAVMSYRFEEELLKRAEMNYTHAFCDLSVCEETVLLDKWVFIRREDTFAALYSSNGITVNRKGVLKEKELISPGINTTWLVKTAAQPEIGSFEEFMQWMIDNPPVVKDGRLLYRDFEYGQMEFALL